VLKAAPTSVVDLLPVPKPGSSVREALPGDHPYRFLIHDRDSIFSEDVDKSRKIWVYRFFGRRCGPRRRTRCASDWAAVFVAMSRLLYSIQRTSSPNDYSGLDHALQPREATFIVTFRSAWAMSDQVLPNEHRHRLPLGYRVAKRSVLGGLHHEYGLVKERLAAIHVSHRLLQCGLAFATERLLNPY